MTSPRCCMSFYIHKWEPNGTSRATFAPPWVPPIKKTAPYAALGERNPGKHCFIRGGGRTTVGKRPRKTRWMAHMFFVVILWLPLPLSPSLPLLHMSIIRTCSRPTCLPLPFPSPLRNSRIQADSTRFVPVGSGRELLRSATSPASPFPGFWSAK